ncbi:MAG TPA: hypothetical protein VHB23_11850 [Devosiaceae bacterium]|nr:hypothetical protein [Devosiaceae bacterium]
MWVRRGLPPAHLVRRQAAAAAAAHHEIDGDPEDGNLEGLWHKGYTGGAEWIYRNPYPYAPLSDDEIAIATVLCGMAAYLEGGPEVYGFAEAAQDQWLSLALDEALRLGVPVTVPQAPWG